MQQNSNRYSDQIEQNTYQTRLDKLAIILTGVCIIHCLIGPVLLTLIPILASSSIADDEFFHQAILWAVLPTSSIAMFIGCMKHRDIKILGCAIIGITMLVCVAFFAHDIFSPTQEKLATSVAGLLLAYSHWLNYRACQNQPCGDESCTVHHNH